MKHHSSVQIKGVFKSDLMIIILLGMFILISNIAFLIDQPLLALLLPAGIIGLYMMIFQLKNLFYLLFFFIPLSMELELPGGLSTDLIGEPILWALTGMTFILLFTKSIPDKLISTLSLCMYSHLSWILIASIFAFYPLISIKYFVAKVWYVLPLYVLPFYILKDLSDIRRIFKFFVCGVIVASSYFFIQHFLQDLTYLSRTAAGQPIWRNHVNYACTLVVSLPLLLYLYSSSKHPDRWIYLGISALLLVFLYFAFARIAYLSVAAGVIYLFILKWRLTKLVTIFSICVIVLGVLYLQTNNKYLHLAQHKESTIMQLDFQNKLGSTVTGEDISTMERVHRWVAGSNMIKNHPWTGVGPANYYRSYRPYTIYSFETYVSHNPERSGIHNYYLMILVEQGLIGLLFFIFLLFFAFQKIENKFKLRANSSDDKNLLLTIGVVLAMIITINTVNDMIEVIKIGGLFFFILALVQLDIGPKKTE